MKYATASAVLALLATSSSFTFTAAQTSPTALLQTLEALLSSSCRAAVGTLLASNSSFSECLQIPNLAPILANTNSSLIPDINTYITGVCASPACSNATIANATATILSGCSTDLATFGIPTSYVSYALGGYDTIREVACLATNGSAPISTLTNQTIYNTTTGSTNSTNTSSTLCVTDLLTSLQTFLGSPLTNTYIDTILLGGNATAYDDILSIVSNKTLIDGFACNDCVQGAVDIVLENYPILTNLTFSLPLMDVAGLIGGNSTYASTGSMNFTVPSIYEAVCLVPVGANLTLPATLNETAYNTTLPYANATGKANSTLVARSRSRSVKFAKLARDQ